MLKSFLLLVILIPLCFLTTKGQDTLKKDSADVKKETHYELFIHSFSRSRDAYRREHQQQDSIRKRDLPPEKPHPTLYLDGGVGFTFSGLHGLEGNYSLNYQYKSSLFTFRGTGISTYATYNAELSPFTIFPYFKESGGINEYALMYGWRYTNHLFFGFSFSAGISTDEKYNYYYAKNEPRQQTTSNYAGIPFEANYELYTPRFGVSFGIKFSGDISQHGYIGMGVDLGLGFHNTPKATSN